MARMRSSSSKTSALGSLFGSKKTTSATSATSSSVVKPKPKVNLLKAFLVSSMPLSLILLGVHYLCNNEKFNPGTVLLICCCPYIYVVYILVNTSLRQCAFQKIKQVVSDN